MYDRIQQLPELLPTFDAPDGPSVPFGDGVLGFDLVRLVIIGCALVLLVLSIVAIAISDSPSQRVRFGSLACFVLVTAGTELAHLGDTAHWRLWVNLVATGLSAWGVWAYLRYEAPGAWDRMAAREERRRERRRRSERADLLEP